MKYLKHLWMRTGDWLNRHILLMLFIIFAVGGGFVVLLPSILVKIPVSNKGVIYRPLSGGVDLNYVYAEGLHFIFPFNTMTMYSIALNVHKMDMEVLTSDLLKTKLTLSFQYSANEQTLPLLERYVGKDYLHTYILPELTSNIRAAFGKLNSHEAFTTDLKKVSDAISIGADNFLIDKLSPAGLNSIRLVRISAVQIESVAFPEDVQKSIESKLIESSRSDAMPFKIEIAKQEAQRKVIEADGIKKYQDIVNSGLTDNYLKHQGIQATLQLAESNNSKVVIFGSSNGGLPLILGDNDTGRASDTKVLSKSDPKTTVETDPNNTTIPKSDSKLTSESKK
jgi:regulator of protease activity HflC (stomatin/prohibitin superfamily)